MADKRDRPAGTARPPGDQTPPTCGAATDEPEFLRDFRCRIAAEGGVFPVDDGQQLAIFDPELAHQVNAVNWRRFTLPDRLVDILLRRRSREVAWVRVRGAWLTALRRFAGAGQNARMAARMAHLIDARLDTPVDLGMLAQDLAVETLLPVALTGLSPREERWIRHDLDQKLMRLLTRRPFRAPWHRLHFLAAQIRAGLVVRRVIRQRAAGRRPPADDLADGIINMLPELGMDRALETVTAVITAIGGPPGAAATSMFYELARYPDWADRLTAELTAVDPESFYANPVGAAPMTHRFVREVLRMWSPPLLLGRFAQTDLDAGRYTLRRGQPYLLSAYLIHRDERYWPRAETFDPDRWLPGAPHGPAARWHYVPFGWAPKACVGADLGINLLMLLAYLMCTRYRLDVPAPGSLQIGYFFAAVPRDFQGRILRRGA